MPILIAVESMSAETSTFMAATTTTTTSATLPETGASFLFSAVATTQTGIYLFIYLT